MERIRFWSAVVGTATALVLCATPAQAFLSESDGETLTSLAGIVAVFGMPVMIVAIILYFMHRRHKLVHETIRAMIEKGMPVTPELVAELKSKRSSGGARARGRGGRLFPGLILVGIGGGLLISEHGRSSGGWIVLFVGIAFLVVWLVERQNPDNAPPPPKL
jgi:hypothetical protein